LYMHNETVNIFSHLLPSIFFIAAEGCIYTYFQYKFPESKILDRLVFALYLLTAAVCMACSAIYHTVLNHSEKVAKRSLQFDLAGILVLTWGIFWSAIYVAFYCETNIRWGYWAMSLFLCLSAITMLMRPSLQGQQWRTLRICTFIGTGLSGFIPIIHGIALFGFKHMTKQTGIPYYLGEGVLLGLGAFFYGSRIPECKRPGKFDIYGASHQIFHVLVVLATIVHLVAITLVYDHNYHHSKCRS